MSSNVDDRLNWLAMQYVLGELSDADRDRFEGRLADDLTACEAVAEASRTKLVLHAAIASSVLADRPIQGRPRLNSELIPGLPQIRIATGHPVASTITHVVSTIAHGEFVAQSPTGGRAMVAIQRSRQAVAAAVVAVACLFLVMIVGWRDGSDSSQSRVARHTDRAAMELVSRWRTEMKLADVESDDLDDELHDSSTDIAVPGWLLAGVSLEKQGVIDGQPEDLQDN